MSLLSTVSTAMSIRTAFNLTTKTIEYADKLTTKKEPLPEKNVEEVSEQRYNEACDILPKQSEQTQDYDYYPGKHKYF